MKLFACPICQGPLVLESRTLGCGANHCFDLSRRGHVNLLPVQNRKSKSPGDNPDMVLARSHFLAAGHYDQLSHGLCAMVSDRAARNTLVDLGCGEGFFTASLASGVGETYGIDVSKAAIVAASRRPEPVFWAVASSARIPLIDDSVDIATAVMAPIGTDVVRILKTEGTLIRVSPGPDHLQEFKARVYADATPHKRLSNELTGFRHVEARQILFSMCLDPESQNTLLSMTPMAYRTSKERVLEADQVAELNVSGEFVIDLFEKLA